MKFLFIFLVIISGNSVWASNCKGFAYTSLDTGDVIYSKVKARYIGGGQFQSDSTSFKPRYVHFVFNDERKSHWEAYRYQDKEELLQWGGYYETSKIDYTDLKFDQSTIIMLKDRAVVGFNLLCRI